MRAIGQKPGAPGRNKAGKNGYDGKSKCEPYSDEALRVNVEIMRDVNAPVAARLNASQWIFDHAYGSVPKSMQNPDGSNIAPAGFVVIGDLSE